MKRKLVFLLTGIMILASMAVIAQEEKEKKFEWTPEMEYQPPADILVGLDNLGRLETGDKDLQITAPYAFKVKGDDLYIFDVVIEKLLLFDSKGNFKKSLFAKDQTITNAIRNMDIDEKGRVLLSDQQDIYVFDNGKISNHPNEEYYFGVVWNGENIAVVNSYANERNEGVIKELNLKGEVLNTFGEYFNKKDRPFGNLVRLDNHVYYSDGRSNKLIDFDLVEKTSRIIEVNDKSFDERIKQTQASIDYKEKTNARSWRTFPVFGTVVAFEDKLYMGVYDKNFLTIIAVNKDGGIVQAFRGLKPAGENGGSFSVAKVDDKLKFFVEMGTYENGKSNNHIYTYAPGNKIPTLADIKKKELTPEENAKKAEMEKRRKVWNYLMAAENKSRATEDPEKKKQIILEAVAKYPDEMNAAYMAGYVGGKERDKKTAAEVLTLIDSVLPKVTNEEVKQIYLYNIITLTSELEQKERMLTTIDQFLKTDPEMYFLGRVMVKLEEKAEWPSLLKVAESGISGLTDKNLMENYGGMSKDKLKEVKDRFLCEYLVFKARALNHLDRAAEALPFVEESAKISPKLYTGNFANKADLAHAEALYFTGKKEEAVDVLLPGALFSGSKEKEDFLRKIYAESGRKEDFDDFLWAQRLKLAKKIDDVNLFTLDRKPVKLSSKFGKATILTFWTPST